MAGALDGVKVLEFSEVIAAPTAGMVLADMGADVIKVEPPWGESWRLNLAFVPLESRGFIAVNRGKRSLPLDLTKREALEIAHELAQQMDVVLVNYRPDVPAKLRIDYETLSAINPRIVYGEATAFGKEGPHANRPGYDLIAQAVSGLIANDQKFLDGVPSLYQSTPFVDLFTGSALASGVIAALFARERTGRGQKVETSLLQSALSLQGLRSIWIEVLDAESQADFVGDIQRMRRERRSIGDAVARYNEFQGRKPGNQRYFYRTYATADGAIAVGCLSTPLRKRLLDVLGIEGTGVLASTGPSDEDDGIMEKAVEVIAGRTTEEWVVAFDAAGVPAGQVTFAEELWDDPQVLANDMAVEVDHSLVGRVRMASPLAKLSDTFVELSVASPALGQHTEEILRELGYDSDRVEALRRMGVTA
jgi:crotonobetainyl-CoA:carnitine CoA-transferase CaiB-like acyl-CoA transferase